MGVVAQHEKEKRHCADAELFQYLGELEIDGKKRKVKCVTQN
jgi:hypothetical protein